LTSYATCRGWGGVGGKCPRFVDWAAALSVSESCLSVDRRTDGLHCMPPLAGSSPQPLTSIDNQPSRAAISQPSRTHSSDISSPDPPNLVVCSPFFIFFPPFICLLPGGVVVRVLARDTKGRRFDSRSFHFQVTTLGKLFTHMCLCHEAV